jgi:hypothetical protein
LDSTARRLKPRTEKALTISTKDAEVDKMGKRIAIAVMLLVTTVLTIAILRGVKTSNSSSLRNVSIAASTETVGPAPQSTSGQTLPNSTAGTETTKTTAVTSTTNVRGTTTTTTTTSVSSVDLLPGCATSSATSSSRTSIADPSCYPAPPAALWATGAGSESFVLGGAAATIALPIRAVGGVVIRGAGHQVLGGVRYGESVRVTGSNHRLKPPVSREKNMTPPPFLRAVDFTADSMAKLRPRIVSEKSCADGTWFVSLDRLNDNTIYLAGCNVKLSGVGSKNVGIVATGSIEVSGAGMHLHRPVLESTPTNSLTAGGPITISGAGVEVDGVVVSDASVTIVGSGASVCGGVYAPNIEISGANFAAKPCELG